MKKIYVSGSKVSVLEVDRIEDKLPLGNYNIEQNPMTGEVYLTIMSDLKMPETEFVDTSVVDKWLTSFKHFDSNLGILLSGLKGAGKTVLAKKLCIKSGLPVLHLNSPVGCAALAGFLANPMFHNCVVFIDEFEKIIDQRDEQIASWLKLMDGGFNTKLLFLMTSNGDNMNDYLMNRLSRIKYRRHFNALSDDTIQRIIDEFLVDKQFEQNLKDTCMKITLLSIDILINIIQEINLFNKPASELVKDLNLINSKAGFDVQEEFNGEWLDAGYIYTDLAELEDEDLRRTWVDAKKREVRDELNRLTSITENKGKPIEQLLTKEQYKLFNTPNYHSFDEPVISKDKDGYIVLDGDYKFRFIPIVKSNMLF